MDQASFQRSSGCCWLSTAWDGSSTACGHIFTQTQISDGFSLSRLPSCCSRYGCSQWAGESSSGRRSRTLRNEYGPVATTQPTGGIAQLVEHYAGSVRVRGSSPLASTKERLFLRAFFSAN